LIELLELTFNMKPLFSLLLFLAVFNSCNNNDFYARAFSDENFPDSFFNQNGSFKQEIRLMLLADAIAKCETLDGPYTGIGSSRSKQYDRSEQLKTLATTEQLIALTKHAAANVRCYSFDFLVERNVDSAENVLLSHIRDTQTVSVFSGCEINDVYVNVYFFSRIASKLSHSRKLVLKKELSKSFSANEWEMIIRWNGNFN